MHVIREQTSPRDKVMQDAVVKTLVPELCGGRAFANPETSIRFCNRKSGSREN